MEKDALLEIQSMFPRQKSVNAIDVFLSQKKNSSKRMNFGSIVKCDCIVLKTPSGRTYCNDRYFEGSSLSKSVFDSYNLSYGVVSLIAQLYINSKSSLGKEIVRAFTKNVISVTRLYCELEIPEDVICSNTIKFPSKDDFYSRIFDPELIRKKMRIRARKRSDQLVSGGLHLPRINLDQKSTQRQLFLEACNEFGLTSVQDIVEELDNLRQLSQANSSGIGLVHLLSRFSRPTNKKFYKAIDRAFR